MKRTFFRAFGIACFLIGAIIFFIDRFNLPIEISNSNNETSEQQNEIKALKKQLDEAKKENKKLESQLKNTNNQNETTKTPDQTKGSNDNQENIVKGTLYIYSGLTIYDVANKLKEMGIIENSVEMELFLAQPEYSKYLQIGQYDLDSSMSIEEIANIITGKKKE